MQYQGRFADHSICQGTVGGFGCGGHFQPGTECFESGGRHLGPHRRGIAGNKPYPGGQCLPVGKVLYAEVDEQRLSGPGASEVRGEGRLAATGSALEDAEQRLPAAGGFPDGRIEPVDLRPAPREESRGIAVSRV